MDTYLNLLTPIGRIVGGDCYKGDDKDYDGKPLVGDDGQPYKVFTVALAIEKANPEWTKLEQAIIGKVREDMPTMFDENGNALRPDMSYKIIDGDSQVPNKKGNKPCDKEGYPGHWIVKFKSYQAPACFKKGEYNRPLPDGGVKRGDYVQVAGSVKGNGRTDSPGALVYFDMVQLISIGDPISSRPDANTVFSNADTGSYMPAGAQAGPQAQAAQPTQQAQPDHAFVTDAGASVELRVFNGQNMTRPQLLAAGVPEAMIEGLPRA